MTSMLPRPGLPDDLGFPQDEPGPGLRVTFLGTAGVLIRSGSTALMVDGFFSRPRAVRTVVGTLRPDPRRIDACLQRAGIGQLDALIVSHSHYDHAMDAAAVVTKTGALLVGSQSTAMIGRGAGVPESRILTPGPDKECEIGPFSVTLMPSGHVPPVHFPGTINRPLRPPARLFEFKVGDCYSLHVQHAEQSLQVHGSAGYLRDGRPAKRAQVVYLGIGTLGLKSESYREKYWQDVVIASGAQRVVPIHWDNYWRPLSKPLVPLPFGMDDFARTIDFLRRRSAAAGIDLRLPRAFEVVDPFFQLP